MLLGIDTTQEKVDEAMKYIGEEGEISGKNFKIKGISGQYSFDGNELIIKITDKPFYVSDSMIKSKLSEIFE